MIQFISQISCAAIMLIMIAASSIQTPMTIHLVLIGLIVYIKFGMDSHLVSCTTSVLICHHLLSSDLALGTVCVQIYYHSSKDALTDQTWTPHSQGYIAESVTV